MTTLEEHRALADEQARHDHEVTPEERELLLPEIRRYIATLLVDIDGWETLEPDLNDGPCDDCGTEGGRWIIGRMHICRDDAITRLHARHKAEQPHRPEPVLDLGTAPRERDRLPEPVLA